MIADWLRQFNMSRTSSITGAIEHTAHFGRCCQPSPKRNASASWPVKCETRHEGSSSPSP